MKRLKLTLLASLVLLSLATFAFPASQLSVRAADNSYIEVWFDNQFFNPQSSVFNVANVRPGTHKLKVIRVFYDNWGHHHPHVKKQIIYKGYLEIPAASEVRAEIKPFNSISVQAVPLVPTHCGNGPVVPLCGNGYNQSNYDGYNNGWDNNGWNNDNGYNNGYNYGSTPNNIYHNNGYMSDSDFERLSGTLKNTSFTDTKLSIAKQAVSTNKLSSAQVAQLTNELQFDSTKLEFAKYAYQYVGDKKNYYLLNNCFTFDSSKHELDQYIGGK